MASGGMSFSDRDEFNRKLIAENIIRILNSDIDISTLVIDGKWGTGKTEFCQKLIKLAGDQSAFSSAYIDAYKYDHLEDPMLVLIGTIAGLIEDEDSHRDLLESAVPVIKVLGKHVAKASVGWLLRTDADDVGESFVEALAEGAGDLTDQGIRNLLADFEKCDEGLENLRSTLIRITKSNRLVVFIDELDRCRPIFALAILEKIKHVFDVPNIKFVLSTNVNQIESMVKKQYGHEIDAEAYLSKFFSYKVRLPDRQVGSYDEDSSNSIRHFSNLIKTDVAFAGPFGNRTSLFQVISYLIEEHQLSLRDVESYFRNLKIMKLNGGHANAFPDQGNVRWGYQMLCALAVFIYSFKGDLTEKVLRKTCGEEDFNSLFKIGQEQIVDGMPKMHTMVYMALTQKTERSYLSKELKEFWDRASSDYSSYENLHGQESKHAYLRRVLAILQMT